MAKVTINGEIFDYDPTRKPLFEALVIERALKCRYVDWEKEIISDEGASMKSLAAFVWLIWHRDGRDVPLEDLLTGKAPEVNLNELTIEADGGDADPTSPPPDPSNTTAGNTPESSPRSSTSGPGRSRSSARPSSKT